MESKLTFLGNGSAFNFEANNTSAYFIENESIYIFDCGESIFNKILKLDLLKDVKNIYIFITHTHSDHIGSLEALIFYCHFNLQNSKNLQIFYNSPKILTKILKLTGVLFKFKINKVPSIVGNYQIKTVIQKHIFGSYGYFFYGKDCSFFYSGDTCEVNEQCIKELKEKKINFVYHEVCLEKSPIHTEITKLTNAFDENLRNKVFLMHFGNDTVKQKCKELGFNIVNVKGN